MPMTNYEMFDFPGDVKARRIFSHSFLPDWLAGWLARWLARWLAVWQDDEYPRYCAFFFVTIFVML